MTHRKKDPYLPPDDALWFLPLGGSGEIGMNLNLYGTHGQWLMVDCGVLFGDESTPGIDIIVPDISFIAERRAQLCGLVITHGHEDHLGAIEHVWADLRCPIYATPFTAEMIRRKLSQAGLHEARIVEVEQGVPFALGPFSLEMVPITHSVPESSVVAIGTPFGRVLHTGDWKLDDEPIVGKLTDEDRLRDMGRQGVLALVGDSTGAMVPEATPSEIAVQRGLLGAFRDRPGRIVVTCFASNIARVKSVAAAALASGRYVSMVGRSLWRNAEIARDMGYLPEFDQFLSENEAMLAPREKIVMLSTGCQGEARAALSRIAMFDHPVVELERGDVVIYSSREIPGNEKAIGRVQNLLLKRGIEIVTSDHAFVHASGHAGQPDMARLYAWTKPQLVVPVHGELRHQMAHAKLAASLGFENAIIPENGQLIRLGPGVHEIVAEVGAGRWGLDGKILRALDGAASQKNRRKMNFNGVAVVTLVLDRHGALASDPQLSLIGVEEDKALIALREDVIDEILDEIDVLPRAKLCADEALRSAIVKLVRSHLHEVSGKKPIIEVHIVRV